MWDFITPPPMIDSPKEFQIICFQRRGLRGGLSLKKSSNLSSPGREFSIKPDPTVHNSPGISPAGAELWNSNKVPNVQIKTEPEFQLLNNNYHFFFFLSEMGMWEWHRRWFLSIRVNFTAGAAREGKTPPKANFTLLSPAETIMGILRNWICHFFCFPPF